MLKVIRISLFFYILFFCIQRFAVTKVIYPAPESSTDTRHDDLIELLKISLDKTVPLYGQYTMEPTGHIMNEARSLAMLKAGEDLNIVWSSTSVEKERDFLPVRIPLRKGILGYRICIINTDYQSKIDKVKTLDDLRQLVIGQGFGWGDIRLYEDNGINVITADYENLFLMLSRDRFDLFPRGISEAFKEYNERKDKIKNISIEEHLLIHYPWPFYCFFNKKDKELAGRIENGLRTMIADGSFDAVFKKYNDRWIKSGNLKQRRVINIINPYLPKETPLNDKALWFDPSTY